MISVKETELYKEVIKEFDYSFGRIYVFQGFVVAEMNEGVVINWDDHGRLFTDDLSTFLETDGKDLIYISNRINSYSVIAPDWGKFFKSKYKLKAYIIVSNEKISVLSTLIEGLFIQKKIKRFTSLYTAVNSIKSGLLNIE